MTQERIWDMLRRGQANKLYEEGLLDICDLRFAVSKGWMTLDDATSWGEVLMNI